MKKKVLMIGPARSVHGGISGVVNNYYEAGLKEKIDLCYIGTMVEGSKIRKLLKAMTAYIQFLCKLPKYQIVHVNVASDASYVRKSLFIRTAKLAGKKIVIHQHGGDFEGYYGSLSPKGKESVKKVLSMGDAFVTLTPVGKVFFGNIVNPVKIIILPNAVRIPEAVSKEYGQKKLLFLGRICKEKGIGELLHVMPRLKQQFPDVMLYLGGIWEDEKLKKQVEACSDCVTYIGWISGKDKEKYLTDCDIFVLPTYFEGQPVSVLEAMAYSCAIAASEVGGIPQMITQGQTGILMQPKDENSLQDALTKLLANPELCKQLGENAREKIQKEFSIEESMKRLLSIYEKL